MRCEGFGRNQSVHLCGGRKCRLADASVSLNHGLLKVLLC